TVAKPLKEACWHKPAPSSRLAGSVVPCSKEKQPATSVLSKAPERAGHCPKGMSRLTLTLGAITLAGLLLAPTIVLAVDINTATVEQLQEVKGIGPKMARTIIEERQRGGRFESMTDVSERVKGVGPKKAAAFKASGLVVGAGALSAASASVGGKKANVAAAARKR